MLVGNGSGLLARPGRQYAVRVDASAAGRMRLISRPDVGGQQFGAAAGPPAPSERASQLRRAVPAPEAPPSAPASPAPSRAPSPRVIVHGVHHVALICASLEESLAFYQGVLGLELNPDRPDDKLPYRGAWLWIGPEMIHLMELPNPDPSSAADRPPHGGRDRHFCVGVSDLAPLVAKLEACSVPYTRSASGRPAVFFRDPDANVIEAVANVAPWR